MVLVLVFGIDGLEMVVFIFIVPDGPGMFEFVWESGCSTVDGLGIGYVMGIYVGNCGGNICLVIQ